MVDELHLPDAVFARLRRLPSVAVEASPNGTLRLPEPTRLGDPGRITDVYGSAPVVREASTDPNWGHLQHPDLELDLRLFSLYYLGAARDLGERQISLYSSMLSALQQDYRSADRRQDFRSHVRPVLRSYRSVIDIYYWCRSSARSGGDSAQQARSRQLADLADRILAATGIAVPPPPTSFSGRAGGALGRPNRARASRPAFSGTQSGAESVRRISRAVDDYNSLKNLLFRNHPIFVFIHQNRTSHQELSSLAFVEAAQVTDQQIDQLRERAIREIRTAKNSFQRAVLQRDWTNIRPILDLAKAALFGEEAGNRREYELARVIDEAVASHDSLYSGLATALMVVGVVLALATGGLGAPIVILIEVALAATGEILAAHQFLQTERDNIQRESIARLELIDGGIRVATQQEDLSAQLWMMLFAAALSVAIPAGLSLAGRGIRSIIARRVAAEADELIAAAGSPLAWRRAAARPARVSRSAERPQSGRPAQATRGSGRQGQAVRQAAAEGPAAGRDATRAAVRAGRTVDEAALPAQRILLFERGGVRMHLTSNNGVVRLWRCSG